MKEQTFKDYDGHLGAVCEDATVDYNPLANCGDCTGCTHCLSANAC